MKHTCPRIPAMAGKPAAAAALLLAVCVCCGPLLAQPAQPTVAKITVRNNYLLTREQILSTLGIAQGVPLDAQQLEATTSRWNQAGTYGTITHQIAPDEFAGRRTVELILTVTERVQVTAVTFRGNKHLSSARLMRMTGQRAGDTVTGFQVRAHERAIAVAYRKKGFPLAQVQARLSVIEPSQRELVFYVSEGQRAWVEKIILEGNEQVDDDELRDLMRSRTRWWIGWLGPGWLDEETLQQDVRVLQAAYRARGYLDAQVGGYVSYSEDMSRIALHVVVYEGDLYRIKEIAFRGNTIYRDDELLAETPLAPGQPCRQADLDEAAQRISALYAGQGYMDVTRLKGNLRVTAGFPAVGPEATVEVTIIEGKPVFIRRIEIRGLTQTKESVVRRNLTFYPRERASRAKMKESERVLLGTGLFDMESPQPVRIILEPDEGTLRDAIVQVKEGPTGRFGLGGGVGSESGLIGQMSLVEENFDIWNWPSSWNDLWRGNALRGGGQRLSLRLSGGTRRTYNSIAFHNPAVWDTDYSFGTELYSATTVRHEFDHSRTGLRITVGKRLSRFLSRSVTVGYESIDVDDVSPSAAAEIRRDEGSYSRPSVALAVSVDHRDNPFTPTEGYLLNAQLEVADGDVETVKLILGAQKYWTVRENRQGSKHVIGLRGRAGMVDSYGDRVPVFERFYAGGFTTLRGFAFEGVSPVDPITKDPVGGKSMLLGSVEYSLPLSSDGQWGLITFLDTGYVCTDLNEILSGWDELRLSVGVGIRRKIPFLSPAAIGADLAFPILKEPDDDTQHFHFFVGTELRF